MLKQAQLEFVILVLIVLLVGCAEFAPASGGKRARAAQVPSNTQPAKEFRFNYPAGEFVVEYRDGQYQIEIDQYANPPKKYRGYTHDKADNLAVIDGVGLLLW
ncbi:MAG: hypothetical protein KDH09_16190, partial [Chrysiogenetes bacterium]|nr:hypothetical protein [Chrysiogenetes bacterium]